MESKREREKERKKEREKKERERERERKREREKERERERLLPNFSLNQPYHRFCLFIPSKRIALRLYHSW